MRQWIEIYDQLGRIEILRAEGHFRKDRTVAGYGWDEPIRLINHGSAPADHSSHSSNAFAQGGL
jgi:hypothetical protein